MTSSNSNETSSRHPLLEAFLVWAGVIFAIHILYQLRFISWIKDSALALTGCLLIYIPALVLILRKESANFFENNWPELRRSLKILIIFSLLIFLPLLPLNHFFQQWAFGHAYHPAKNPGIINLPLLRLFWIHLLMVALPEEFFFRGYFNKRLRAVFHDRFYFLGVPMGWAFFINVFFFALSHSLINLQWWHFAIFFPALAFSWLREKTGALTAPIFFHAFCNTFSAWVSLHYS